MNPDRDLADAAPPEPRFFGRVAHDEAALRAELGAGLSAQPSHVAPKYLYDALGSRLFDAITELPEYYPTRTEAAIFARDARAIAQAIGAGATLVDLGAGNCEKAASLFPALAPAAYVALDISGDFLRESLTRLQRRFPRLPMTGVAVDFSTSLDLPEGAATGRPVFFYPGSSIGNFTPAEARGFLARIRGHCGERGGLLIGVDNVKPREVLEPAYDDALGVTAAFNLNLLLHLNKRIGSDFRVADWSHVALWNEAASRIEMHLEARRATHVRWRGGERRYAHGERIHTENSYKYRPEDFDALLRDAGFAGTRRWSDERGWFSVVWASAA